MRGARGGVVGLAEFLVGEKDDSRDHDDREDCQKHLEAGFRFGLSGGGLGLGLGLGQL